MIRSRHEYNRFRIWARFLQTAQVQVVVLVLAVITIAVYHIFIPTTASANSTIAPTVPESNVKLRVARAVTENGVACVKNLIGVFDLDEFTRIGLSSEITSASESAGGMKAMSLVIRGIGRYHVNHPQSGGFCQGTTPFTYDVHSYRVAFASLKSSKTHGIVGSRANDRSTDTMGKYVDRQAGRMVYFNDCIHQMMNSLADSSPALSPQQVVTTVYASPDTCATQRPCSNVDPDHCRYTDLVETNYSLHHDLTSMTNRTAARTPPYSSQTTNAFGFNQTHQAEVFWGNDMSYGLVNPHGQAGTYIIGTGHANLAEYLVNYDWGAYATLYVNAISDRPANVIANVYVDGYYRGAIYWTQDDNQRHLGSIGLPYSNAGLHTITIQFREAAWLGGGADGTRWLYLDDLGIVP